MHSYNLNNGKKFNLQNIKTVQSFQGLNVKYYSLNIYATNKYLQLDFKSFDLSNVLSKTLLKQSNGVITFRIKSVMSFKNDILSSYANKLHPFTQQIRSKQNKHLPFLKHLQVIALSPGH